MEGNIAKVLDRRYRLVVDAKKRKASKHSACLIQSSRTLVPQLPGLKAPSAKLGKRKKPDGCSAKCRSCEVASGRSLYLSYSRFMRSRIPSRLMCLWNNEWVDLPFEILDLVKKDFEQKKGVTEVNINGYHLLLDFLHMSHLDVKTGAEKPMAWIDEAGKIFFPEVLAFDDQQDGYCESHADSEDSYLLSNAQGQHEIKLQIEIELNGLNASPTAEYCGESNPLVKRVKIAQRHASHDLEAEVGDSSDRVSNPKTNKNTEHLDKNLDMKIQSTDKTLASEDVRVMFLKGMNSAAGVDIISISHCSGSMLQARMELFLKQVEITNVYRGHANVQYAWLASSKGALSSIMAYGLGPLGLPKFEPSYGIGAHLAAANYSGTSTKYCDVDENGIGHMILCRVITGNMELVHPGSKQFYPSSEKFDIGVDDLDNPQLYVVWSMNINTHIYPEFVVSFKISLVQEGFMAGSEKLEISGVTTAQHSPDLRSNIWACASPVDMGCQERAFNLNSNRVRIPKSPWMPMPLLLAAIANKVSADDMKVISAHFESYKAKKIPRVDFVRTLRTIVGDPLLRSTINMLQYKVPSEHNGTIEVPKQETLG